MIGRPAIHSARVQLEDGRRLGYTQWGDPDGSPIFHCHGMPGSRLEHEADGAVYAALGVRVITADRPGYGLSDPRAGRQVIDWASDVGELADRLGIERFAVTALSGGGAFALACAAAMPDRVTRVVTAGCPAPFDVPGLMKGVPARFRFGLWLAARAPQVFSLATDGVAVAVRRFPDFFVEHVSHDNPADRRWLSMPTVRAEASAMIHEAFRRGGRGYAGDVIALAQPWGFELGDVRTPVELWHGGLDNVIPITHAWHLASVLPRATLTICPGDGHMLMWNRMPQILRSARGAGAAAVWAA